MSGADLLINGSTVNDAVTVAADGYFDSDVTGSVTNSGGYGVHLEGASVGGAYLCEAGEDADASLYSFDGSFGEGIDYAQAALTPDSRSCEQAGALQPQHRGTTRWGILIRPDDLDRAGGGGATPYRAFDRLEQGFAETSSRPADRYHRGRDSRHQMS